MSQSHPLGGRHGDNWTLIGTGRGAGATWRGGLRSRAPRLPGRRRQAQRGLVTRFLAWRAQRETVRILSRLDGATLRDLGITDIESEVYGDPDDRKRGYDPCWWKR